MLYQDYPLLLDPSFSPSSSPHSSISPLSSSSRCVSVMIPFVSSRDKPPAMCSVKLFADCVARICLTHTINPKGVYTITKGYNECQKKQIENEHTMFRSQACHHRIVSRVSCGTCRGNLPGPILSSNNVTPNKPRRPQKLFQKRSKSI